MKVKTLVHSLLMISGLILTTPVLAEASIPVKAGDPALAHWILPKAPVPEHNVPNAAKIELGKALFFDPRLSRDGNMSCATCHNPALGWSDGLATAKGVKSSVLGRASPTIVNSAYYKLMMWDGRKKNLEDQATGPLEAAVEMNTDMEATFKWLNSNEGYKKLFAAAYPGEAIDKVTLARAIASFESTIIMNDSPFDRWLAGDAKAMTEQQVRGFEVFINPNKGNCAVCHAAPNFTDDGFHNIGLASFGNDNPDMGRFSHKAVKTVKGAFKTPQLRGITQTAPYFHDGSAKNLMDVVEHYNKGGENQSNLSPNLRKLNLSTQEKEELVAFMKALTGTTPSITIPVLPE